MSDIVVKKEQKLMHLLHGKQGKLEIPKPFSHEIFLFDTHIAGTTYISEMEEIEKKLQVGETLNFFREPKNSFDKQAIVIKTLEGVRLGYVPKVDNIIFARLMDAGKNLFARISEKKKQGKWIKIEIKVFLRD